MTIATKCTNTLLWIYKKINQTGLLNKKYVQSIYVVAYFKYKRYLEDSYARLIKHHAKLFQGGHILDIGANIGYTAFIFSKAINYPYKILAFEPENRNFQILQHVSQKYGFANQLISIEAAVGDKEGNIELWKNEANSSDHRILTDELKNKLKGTIKFQKSRIVTIDNHLKNYKDNFPISFIKIDVQGYELAVCKGMIDTLDRNPNAVISFEYCPDILGELGFNPISLLHFFQKRGYLFFSLNKKNIIEKLDVTKLEMKSYDYVDILCSKNNLCRDNILLA